MATRPRRIKRWMAASGRPLHVIAIHEQSCDAGADIQRAESKSVRDHLEWFRGGLEKRELSSHIHDHLSWYEPKLRQRQDQGRYWWELRACTYYHEFVQSEDHLQPIHQLSATFAYDQVWVRTTTTHATFCHPSHSRQLAAVVNSTPSGGGYYRISAQRFAERLPPSLCTVPRATSDSTVSHEASNTFFPNMSKLWHPVPMTQTSNRRSTP